MPLRYNSLSAAALDPNHIGVSSGRAFDSENEAEFLGFLKENPDAQLALQTMLMRYAYTLTFEVMPSADGERLSEVKGSVYAVRFLLDLFSNEDTDRTLSMTTDELREHGLAGGHRPFG